MLEPSGGKAARTFYSQIAPPRRIWLSGLGLQLESTDAAVRYRWDDSESFTPPCWSQGRILIFRAQIGPHIKAYGTALLGRVPDYFCVNLQIRFKPNSRFG